jgi:CubicO group peptidase (beta-lactamase class C family)
VQPENIFQPAIEITAESTLTSWSMAKSITHAAVGILVGDGVLDVDAPPRFPSGRGPRRPRSRRCSCSRCAPGCGSSRTTSTTGLALHRDAVRRERPEPCRLRRRAAARPRARVRTTATRRDDEHHRPHHRRHRERWPGGDPVATPRRRWRRSSTNGCSGRSGWTSAIPKFDEAGDFVGSSYVYATARDFAKFGELYRTTA